MSCVCACEAQAALMEPQSVCLLSCMIGYELLKVIQAAAQDKADKSFIIFQNGLWVSKNFGGKWEEIHKAVCLAKW